MRSVGHPFVGLTVQLFFSFIKIFFTIILIDFDFVVNSVAAVSAEFLSLLQLNDF